MKTLSLYFIYILLISSSLNANSFNELLKNIKTSPIKISANSFSNHEAIKILNQELYKKGIKVEHNIFETKTTIQIKDIQEKHNWFWEIKYDKYKVSYQIIDESQSLTNTESITILYPLSPYSLYARAFMIFLLLVVVFRFHITYELNYKIYFIVDGLSLLIIFGLIQGYFFAGVL